MPRIMQPCSHLVPTTSLRPSHYYILTVIITPVAIQLGEIWMGDWVSDLLKTTRLVNRGAGFLAQSRLPPEPRLSLSDQCLESLSLRWCEA